MRKILKVLCMAMLMMGILHTNASQVHATAVVEREPYIVVDNYTLSDESIIPGGEFTLTLELRNPSETATAHDILVDITNPTGFSPIYGTVSQVFVGDMGPKEKATISFTYEAEEYISSDKVDFEVTILSAGNTNYVVLRTPVGTDKPLTVAAITMPSVVYVGAMNSALLDFRVVGRESVSNVNVSLECDGAVIGSSQFGTIIAGSTKTQSVSFTLSEPGEKQIDIYLEYMDAKGEVKYDFAGTQLVDVNEKMADSTVVGGNAITEINTDNYLKLGVVGTAVLVALFGVVVIIRRKK